MTKTANDIRISRIASDHHDLLLKTAAFWEQRCGRPISSEDARELIENVVGYFTLLDKWDVSGKKDIGLNESNAKK